MKFSTTSLSDVILIEPKVFGDSRGFFMETYNAGVFAQAGVQANFVQDNHSGSQKGILRGLHYQIRHAQGKLVRVVSGSVFDVVVDLRRSSPTFGKWMGMVLSAENKCQLWVPPGFAHGYYVMSNWADFFYKVTDFYMPEWERTITWDDPRLSIDWPLLDGLPPLLSARDAIGKRFEETEYFE
jgi:dTDP-4-dehydrorhamnose 3,5-epimerase